MNQEAILAQDKEIYALFGLAYYLASVFETALVNAIICLDYMTEAKTKYQATKTFDAAAYVAGFDALLAKLRKMSLGRLIARVQALAAMDGELQILVADALTRRNFLAHHFFSDRGVHFMTEVGRMEMMAELHRAIKLFEKTDEAIESFTEPFLAQIGYTAEIPKKGEQRYLSEIGLPPDTLSD